MVGEVPVGWLQFKSLLAGITLAAFVAACSTERSEPETILVLARPGAHQEGPAIALGRSLRQSAPDIGAG